MTQLIQLLGRDIAMNRYFSKSLVLLSLIIPFITLILPMSSLQIGLPVPFIIYDGQSMSAIQHSYELFNWSNLQYSFIKLDSYMLNVVVCYAVLVLAKVGIQSMRTPQKQV